MKSQLKYTAELERISFENFESVFLINLLTVSRLTSLGMTFGWRKRKCTRDFLRHGAIEGDFSSPTFRRSFLQDTGLYLKWLSFFRPKTWPLTQTGQLLATLGLATLATTPVVQKIVEQSLCLKVALNFNRYYIPIS